MSAFAELKGDIEANPEGERLSDLLEQQEIKTAVSDLDFPDLEEETNLTRAMGISELPGEAGAGEAPPAESGPSASAAAADHFGAALLDDEVKAKLGAVLDEIITMSVRKAVQEEMPKLMEQMLKDDPRA